MAATTPYEMHLRPEHDPAARYEPAPALVEPGTTALVSVDEWRATRETVKILCIPGLCESILEGVAQPVEECSDRITW